MGNFKEGDMVITPEGNVGRVDGSFRDGTMVVLENGKYERWVTSVLKPHKEKRPLKAGEEVWVRGILQYVDDDSCAHVYTSDSAYTAESNKENDDVKLFLASDVFRKEDIINGKV